LRFWLETRVARPTATAFSKELADQIHSAGGEVVSGEEPPDIVVAVGGDGTMLTAVRVALQHDVPVLGFNLGTLGFLTEAEPDDVARIVKRLMSGEYSVEERMTLTATLRGRSETGVNDVVVEKIDTTRLVSLEVAVDGQDFVTYRADGLILATPTGSTAYSFSAGGPLMDPGIDAIVLTPVAAHSLFDRAIVLSPTSIVTVTVNLERSVRVNVDKTDLGALGESESVEVRRGDRPARFVTLGKRPFAELLRTKFGLS
jgi:NAD+ kinase